MKYLALLALALAITFFAGSGFARFQIPPVSQSFANPVSVTFHKTFVPQTATGTFSLFAIPQTSFTTFVSPPVFQPKQVSFSFGFADP